MSVRTDVTGVSGWHSSGFCDNLQLIFQSMSPLLYPCKQPAKWGQSRVSLTSLYVTKAW